MPGPRDDPGGFPHRLCSIGAMAQAWGGVDGDLPCGWDRRKRQTMIKVENWPNGLPWLERVIWWWFPPSRREGDDQSTLPAC